MASAASLPEPQGLAHTKRRLFPDGNETDSYDVADTQFAAEEWLPDQPLRPDVREQLQLVVDRVATLAARVQHDEHGVGGVGERACGL